MKQLTNKALTFFIICFAPFFVAAQTTKPIVNVDTSKTDTLIPKKVLIVPFSPKMYMSDMNRELLQGGKYEIWAMVAHLSSNMAGVLKQQLSPKLYEPQIVEVINPDPKKDDDLKLIDRSITYKYEPLPQPLDKKKRKAKKSAAELEEEQRFGDNSDKYMKTLITSAKLLPYLKEKYNFDYIVFLNQFEIRNDFSNAEGSISGPSQRIIKLHYTVFKPTGEEVCSNMAHNILPINEVNADEIIKKYFAPLAAEIATCLPEAVLKVGQKNKK